jgi:hypothetical protein
MNRRHFSLSHLVAWTVPFLIVLLVIRTAPELETIVHNHVVVHTVKVDESSRVTSVTTTTFPHAATEPATTIGSTLLPSTVTTTQPTTATVSSKPTGASGVSKETVATTTTTTIPPETGPRGVLTAADSEVDVNLPVGSQWTMSTNGSLTWTLYCNGHLDETDPAVINGSDANNTCSLTIQSDQTTPVTWQLVDF